MLTIKNYEFNRAIFHILPSFILVWLLNYVKPSIFALVFLVIVLAAELIRLKSIKWNNFIINHRYSFFGKIIRPEEKKTFSAVTAFGFGWLLIFWLRTDLIQLAMSINALADPAARICGVKWGRRKIFNTKNTWVGSFAFLVTAFLILTFFFLIIQKTDQWESVIIKSFLIALVGAIAEGLPDKGWLWIDNFRIPVFVGTMLWLLIN